MAVDDQSSNGTTDEAADGEVLPRVVGHALAHDLRLRQRVLHIRISDIETERLKVNLTLPVGLVGVAGRLGARLIPHGHHRSELITAIEHGELHGPVVVDDEQNGERIEISVE